MDISVEKCVLCNAVDGHITASSLLAILIYFYLGCFVVEMLQAYNDHCSVYRNFSVYRSISKQARLDIKHGTVSLA